MKYIKWFEEISKKDSGLVGGKGANLGEMVRMGLPVPAGFVVTTKGYERFLNYTKLQPKIEKLLAGIDSKETKKIALASKKIKDEMLAARIPPDLQSEIESAYKKLGQDSYVAVRSSATAEDSTAASFAGQQSTFLNIKGSKNVCKAVLACFVSLFEARAIFYRLENKFDHFKIKIAVPVQLMIQSEKSGIMFTVDPVFSDSNKIVIEGGYGLGEAIVSGSVTPDRYIVSKADLKIVAREIQRQKWMIKKVGGSNKHLAVAKEAQETQKLSDSEILELADYGLAIEKHYGCPQDIEWAICDNKIYFVQTRPVTAYKKTKQEKVKKETSQDKVLLRGIGASLGLGFGPVRIIGKPTDDFFQGEVLVTEMTNPSFVPLMKKAAAVVTDTGGATSHAAIVSRELGVPCVVGTGKATALLKNGQMVSVDGAQGVVYQGKVSQPIKESSQTMTPPAASFQQESAPITATKVYVNLGEPGLALELAKEPCDGVGLLRAEFMIADIGEHPKAMIEKNSGERFVVKLSDGIRKIAKAFYPRPVVYRATDFKSNEYKNLKGGEKFENHEENPMLGFRGVFRYIVEPDVFRLELLALKRVREQFGLNNLWLMLPFVRTIDELNKVKCILEKEGFQRTSDFKLWIMVEVPSNVFLIDKFCQSGIDGVSIGSNDLTQLILGVDRDNQKLAKEFDERNEAVTIAIKQVISSCRRHNVSCSICGQAPSVYPEFLEMLIESGVTSVSVNPDSILEIKKFIASVEKRILLDKIKEIEGLT